MIRLPNTGTYSLELITAQNGAQSVVSYSDATSSAYTGGTQVASITSATTTTICSTPAASTVRDVDQINIKNTFAGSHTVTVQVDANGTNYPLIVAALLTDESLNYTHGSGWQVKDANGNTKNSALSAMTSAQLAAILTDETGSGAAVFATSPTLVTPALGTPSSGVVTNLTGTASININGTVGATTPAAGTFTTLTSTGNATLGDAEATDTHTIKGATTLLANSASAALTITQTGAGNAFVVEDSASTDGTPFVVNGDGVVISGHTTALVGQESLTPRIQQSFTGSSAQVAFGQFDWSAGAVFPSHQFNKSKSGTQGSHTAGIVASGDVLGQIQWGGSDGTGFIRGASLKAEVDGTPGTNDMPGRLVLSVTADGASSPTEAMRIGNAGNVLIGTGTAATNSPKLDVVSNYGICMSDAATDATNKNSRYSGRHYTNSEEPIAIILGSSISTNSYVNVGGGSSAFNAATNLQFFTAANTTTLTGTKQMEIDGAGLITITAGQIKFPATQNASANANTLDDYEEGTFTPVVRDAAAGNVATAAVAVGFYTKIGNAVRFNLYLTDINTAGLTASNQVCITAMPFAASSTANSHHLHNVLSVSAGPTTGSLSAIQYASTSYLQVQNAITTGTSSFLVSQLTSGSSDLFITGTYYV